MKILNKNFWGVIFLGALCAITPGCTTLKIHHFIRVSNRPVEVENFFHLLDETIENAHVKQAPNFSIPHFPYLRANRFWIELRKNLDNDSQKELWVESMRQMDIKARIKEIHNLPDEDLKKLSLQLNVSADRKKIISKLQSYSKIFLDHEKVQPGFWKTLGRAVQKIPQEYSPFQRVIGFYPIFSVPVILGTGQVHTKFSNWHKTPIEELKVLGTVKNFSASEFLFFYPDDLAEIFSSNHRNALDIPQLTDEKIKKLAIVYAPVYSQDVAADYDQFGEVVWKNNGAPPKTPRRHPCLPNRQAPKPNTTSIWRRRTKFQLIPANQPSTTTFLMQSLKRNRLCS